MVQKDGRFTNVHRFGASLVLMALISWTSIAAFPDGERIGVLGADCASQKTVFTLGDSVCALATGAPAEPSPQRRFEWITPSGTIFQLGPSVVSDLDSNSITLPTSGGFAQPGIWMVKTVDVSNNGYAAAQFMVQGLNKTSADLTATMFAPFQVSAGTNVTFTLIASNNGPNQAENVQLRIGSASNSTPLSASQVAGPPFTWIARPQEANGTAIWAIESLPANATATFVFVCRIDPGVAQGSTISSTATISSSSLELYPPDNVSTAAALITPQPCVVNCPSAVVAVKTYGQCGAAVNYTGAGATGSNCGTLSCNPTSGSFFPVGTTNVICAGNSGSPCSFTVTVDDMLPPALDCPSDIALTENSPGMGYGVARYKSPTVNGTCAADSSACAPPSGSSFPLGATTVTCETTNASGDRSACSFTVTVERSDCLLSCPDNIIRSNRRGECGAAVSYSTPSTAGDCGSVMCTPPAGSVFPIGETTVSCLTSSGAGSTFTVTITDTQAPAVTHILANPSSLFLLNRRMRDVTVDYALEDNCSGELTCTLSVNSDEPMLPGDAPDWEIVDGHHVRLRAELNGERNSRTYTVTINCRDAGGNTTSEAVKVIVRRDRR